MYKFVLFLAVASIMVEGIRKREDHIEHLNCTSDADCTLHCVPNECSTTLDIQSCCCCSRDPYLSKSCLDCLCDLDFCPSFVSPKCGCKCFKDISNPCLSYGSRYGCGCGCGKSLYYPEVEYPCTSYSANPFYYGSCFGY